MTKYIVYELEQNENPVLAIYDSEEEAMKEKTRLAKEFSEELFKADPKETGIDITNPADKQMVFEDCLRTIGIQEIEMPDSNPIKETASSYCFVAYTHKGYNDFHYLCNKIEYCDDSNYCKFINTNKDEDTLLALIPHSELRGIERIEY